MNGLRRGLLAQMASGGQQYEIITVQTSFVRAGAAMTNNFDAHADQTGINYFVRLDADLDDNTLELLIYANGVFSGALRKRSEAYTFLATPGSAHDFKANVGDRYAKIVQEVA